MSIIRFFLAFIIVSLWNTNLHAQSCKSINYKETCWIRNDLSSSKLIIFVHGIDGTAAETWSGSVEGQITKWPELVATDRIFDDADILVINYFSTKWSDSPSIQQLTEEFVKHEIVSRKLLSEREDGTLRYQKLLFVAHSMGGLIVRNAINQSRQLAGRTQAIFTFATPTGGSRLANWLSRFTSSESLDDMVQLFKVQYRRNDHGKIVEAQSSFLNKLRDAWRENHYMEDIPSYCAFETRPTVGPARLRSIVVEKRDVEFLCNRVKGLWGDHNSVVVPDDRWAGHKLLTSWYKELYPDRVRVSSIETRDDVVLVQCDTDFYKFEEYVEMQKHLDDLTKNSNFRWRFSTSLPEDWRDGYKTRIWSSDDTIPSVLIMHYSCFQEGGENIAGWNERTKDNMEFLKSIDGTEIRVVFFSRAFNSNKYEIVGENDEPGVRFSKGDGGIKVSIEDLETLRRSYFAPGCRRIFSVPSSKKTLESLNEFVREFKRQTLLAVQANC